MGKNLEKPILVLGDVSLSEVSLLLSKYSIALTLIQTQETIPGSFWGETEAGLIGNRLYARLDTPVHSILHESCHYICMDQQRRKNLNTNAGGTANEENAVCYLQVLLSDELSFIDRNKIMQDMDNWGYSFRLGSTKAWFDSDAEDAQQWLLEEKLIDINNSVSFNLRS